MFEDKQAIADWLTLLAYIAAILAVGAVVGIVSCMIKFH
jgi:hypothetical protein